MKSTCCFCRGREFKFSASVSSGSPPPITFSSQFGVDTIFWPLKDPAGTFTTAHISIKKNKVFLWRPLPGGTWIEGHPVELKTARVMMRWSVGKNHRPKHYRDLAIKCRGGWGEKAPWFFDKKAPYAKVCTKTMDIRVNSKHWAPSPPKR